MKKENIKKVFEWCIWVIIVLFIAVVTDIVTSTIRSNEKEISYGLTGLTSVVVSTSSMEGGRDSWSQEYKNHINAGDAVIIRKISPEDVNIGDIITFFKEEDQPPVIHRVIAKNKVDDNYEFITRGDANNCEDDGVVNGDNVIGKYVIRIPYYGLVLDFLQKYKIIKYGIIGIISLYFIICIKRWVMKGK